MERFLSNTFKVDSAFKTVCLKFDLKFEILVIPQMKGECDVIKPNIKLRAGRGGGGGGSWIGSNPN